MFDKKKLPVVLGTAAFVIAATLAIVGSSSQRLRRESGAKAQRPLASSNYIQGVTTTRFEATVPTVHAWLSGPTPPLLVDVRPAVAYEAGHLPNAVNRTTPDLMSGQVGVPSDRQVVIYDQDGRLAPLLIHPLRARGVDAFMLAGGYAAWRSPQAPRPGSHAPPIAAPDAASACSSSVSEAAAAVPAAFPTTAPPAAPLPPPPPPKTSGPAGPPVSEGC